MVRWYQKDASEQEWRTMKQYRALFGNRNFLLLWIGSAISYIGDSFNAIALVKVLASDPQHLGFWLSMVMLAKVVPGILLGPVAGVVADRLPRRTVMITADLLRSALVAGLVFTAQPAFLIVLVLLAATVACFHSPASSALLPSLVKPDQLVSASSLTMMTQRMAQLIGSGLGAAATALLGAHNVFWIDSASFIVSACFKVALVLPAAAYAVKSGAAQSLFARFKGDLTDAARFIGRTPTLRRLMTTFGIVAVPDSALNVLLVTFFTVGLGLAAENMGIIYALVGGTAVIGALAIGAVGNRVHWKHLISYGCAYIWFCMLSGILVHNPVGSGAFIALLGFGSGAVNVGAQAAIGLLVPDDVRGRVFAGWDMINSLIYVCGVLVSGALSDLIGATYTLLGFTMFYLVTGIYAGVAFRGEGEAPSGSCAYSRT
jgi:MFS family permease